MSKQYSQEELEPWLLMRQRGVPWEGKNGICAQSGIGQKTLRRHYNKKYAKKPPDTPPPSSLYRPLADLRSKYASDTTTVLTPRRPRGLIYDIETLPNLGYFFDTISDRQIPLDFIVKPKSICTIAYKWLGEDTTHVLVVDTPYDDSGILERFLQEWAKADFVVAHYSKFDKPFIAARLMANGLPVLPPVNDICTYRLAKAHFGRSLNGNKLDHLGTILGVGNKIKTSADLWVKCAQGDKVALQMMADYNCQDVDLLAKVFVKMLPYVRSKVNFNLFFNDPVLRCKSCGSDRLQFRDYEYTAESMKHRYICTDCGAYSCFSGKKVKNEYH